MQQRGTESGSLRPASKELLLSSPLQLGTPGQQEGWDVCGRAALRGAQGVSEGAAVSGTSSQPLFAMPPVVLSPGRGTPSPQQEPSRNPGHATAGSQVWEFSSFFFFFSSPESFCSTSDVLGFLVGVLETGLIHKYEEEEDENC